MKNIKAKMLYNIRKRNEYGIIKVHTGADHEDPQGE